MHYHGAPPALPRGKSMYQPSVIRFLYPFLRDARSRRWCNRLGIVLVAVSGLIFCIEHPTLATPSPAMQQRGAAPPERLPSETLPNLVRVHPRVYSGGLPEGDAAFAELAAMGVKTIISVDGAKPDVAVASRHGLRYVHLPHGYDGIGEQRLQTLAKAVVELPGPIYVHCHHGKHRSPAAASAACVGAGWLSTDAAEGVLEMAGTNPQYRGLYQAVREAKPIAHESLAELTVAFRAVEEIPPMAEAMVELGHTFEHVQQIAAANWQSPADHPDLDPVHEALLLHEHYVELARRPEVTVETPGFREILQRSVERTRELHQRLQVGHDNAERLPEEQENAEAEDGREGQERVARLALLLSRIKADCKACHVRYRDVPLSEKADPQR